jgi:hypothetical protein
MAALNRFNKAKDNLKKAAKEFYDAKTALEEAFKPSSKGGKSRKSRKNRSRK